MALGSWQESSATKYFYGDASVSSTTINTHNTESTARAASFDSGADMPEVIKLSVKTWAYDGGGSGSDKKATFAITVAGSDSRSNAFNNIKTYTFDDASNGSSVGSSLDKTITFNNSHKYWYIKVITTVGGFFREVGPESDTIYGRIEIDSMTRTAYKTKTMVHGAGLQVMSGPDQYMRLGRNENLIYGDLAVSGSEEAGGRGYF